LLAGLVGVVLVGCSRSGDDISEAGDAGAGGLEGVPDGSIDTSDTSGVCGNKIIESYETCDGDCRESCDDRDPCTEDLMTGSADTCDVICENKEITETADNDQCCPEKANAYTDKDCSPRCGNRVVEAGESCDDGNTDANDGCSADCTEIEKCGTGILAEDFRIENADDIILLTDAMAEQKCTVVSGNLFIGSRQSTGSTELQNLDGLNILTAVGGDLIIGGFCVNLNVAYFFGFAMSC
jgi:cysteine-rich repeat protein